MKDNTSEQAALLLLSKSVRSAENDELAICRKRDTITDLSHSARPEMSWSTLSEDVWKHILVHIPLAHRLESCSRVNTTLHRAAAAATQQVELDLREAGLQRLSELFQWMLHHGQHLTSLRLGVYGAQSGRTLQQLPCPHLRELGLHHMQVQLSASNTQPGVLHSCTRLTKLLLQYCQFTDGHSSLSALSALVRLQHLELQGIMGAVVSGSTDVGFMPSKVLQHLTQLTHLSLRYVGRLLNADSLQHTSCLVNLRELNIFNSTITLSPSTTPGLSGLTALRKVRLLSVNIDPSILQDCTQLQDLELNHLAIISAGEAAALHSLLGRLQQLHSLKLFELECDWPVAATAYSTLTASSHLQKLHLTVDDMPAGVWPHVFPPDRQLPALQELIMYWYGWDEPDPAPRAAPGTDDISCLASCCPALCSITISLQPDTQLSDLAKVSGLTSLSVWGLQAEGFESHRALSGLVSLQELSVDPGGPITPQDLLCLTALTGLTKLSIDPYTAPDFEGDDDVGVSLSQVCSLERQRDPPVWLQLLKHCGKFSECQPLIFDSMGQQLAAQQQQIAELQAQLAATREQAASAAAQAAAAQAATAAAAASAAA